MQNGHFSGFSRRTFASWFSQKQAVLPLGNSVGSVLDCDSKHLFLNRF